ncbi:MAG: group 1 truncated hemoglobin [Nannocystis sp.]|nr:group 1 truncated hemoglobin [Nannocystis sp.]
MSTIYEQIGGEPAMSAAVELFYRKVLSDEVIARFFEGVDMERQMGKQKAFLTMVTGGPNNYTGRNMRDAHAHLVKTGLSDVHFDHVVKHLGDTLLELGVPAELVAQVGAAAESMRADVLDR